MEGQSSVDMATPYGLDRLGLESRWKGEIFRTRPERPCGPLSILYSGYRVILQGKAVNPPSFAAVKKRVELHVYSFFAPAWQGTQSV
jgi:hypothetical protein